jgi:hypothetical protein
VDISEHYYAPRTTARVPPQAGGLDPDTEALRQLMGLNQLGAGAAPGPGGEEDPMMRMMMQMMGGAGGGAPGAGTNPFAGNNPFGAMGGQTASQAQTPQQEGSANGYASIWRILHTVVALGLGLYIALWTGFTGSKAEREQAAAGLGTSPSSSSAVVKDDLGDGVPVVSSGTLEASRRFLWAFATAEALLLTTRFFLDRGRAAPSGVLWSVAGFLPQPFRTNVEMVLRYGQIFSTVKSDVLTIAFVLGVCSWLRSS